MKDTAAEITFEKFLAEMWLPSVKSTVRATTYYSYRGIARTHLIPAMGASHLADLSPQVLNGFYATLLVAGHTRRDGGLAASSVIRIHATIHRALRGAVRWGYLAENAADKADPPKQKMHTFEMNTWDASELRIFLDAVSKEPDYAYWLLLAVTGMRRGEVLGLRWEDIDLAEAVIAVRQTVVAVGGHAQLSRPKTSRGKRLVALDLGTVESLRTLWGPEVMKRKGLIFATKDGGPLSGPAITKRFQSLVAQTKLPRSGCMTYATPTQRLRFGLGSTRRSCQNDWVIQPSPSPWMYIATLPLICRRKPPSV